MEWDKLPIIISIISLLISFFVAFTSFWRSLPKIKIYQLDESFNNIIKSYDGVYAPQNYKNLKPKMESLTLVEIVITNNSSLPISILEFNIKGARPFHSYTYTRDTYTVTPDTSGPSYFGTPDKPIEYLKPEFTLDPYTSKRGSLLFWMDNESSIQTGNHKLIIKTSRKTFKNKNINIGDPVEESVK